MQLRHIGIVTKNLKKTLNFYCDFLGGYISKEMNESGSFISSILGEKNVQVHTVKLNLPEGLAQIELLYFLNPKSSGEPLSLFSNGLTHFAITVKNIENIYEKMKKENIYLITEPKISEDGMAKVFFCQDPNGVYIELVEPVNLY